MQPVILYHANCPDGFTAAWAFWKRWPLATFIPVSHGDLPPQGLEGLDVFIVDFCYAPDLLLEMTSKVKTLVVLDHHASSQATCSHLSFCFFDMKKSGAGMAWDYCFPNTPRPLLIDFVEYRDLGRSFTNDTHPWNHYTEIMAAIDSYDRSFAIWNSLAEGIETAGELSSLVLEGQAILRYQNRLVEQIIANTTLLELDGQTVPTVNTQVLISEAAGALAKSYPAAFCLAWYCGKDGTKFSLRASLDSPVDVASWATGVGGGGHKKAAGFFLSKSYLDLINIIKLAIRRRRVPQKLSIASVEDA